MYPRTKGLTKTIETLGKGIKVGTITEKTTIGLGIEIRVGKEIVIGERKMIINMRLVYMLY